MRVISDLRSMERTIDRLKTSGAKIGFVPTMGYLHHGHLSLVQKARQLVGPRGVVILSIYVNPTQFGPREDLSRYPRDLQRDLKLCRKEKVDLVFTPSDSDMYPKDGNQAYSTYVVEEDLTRLMEGTARPGHFRGVTTIVAKLFNIVRPHVAIFGEKDFQQAAVIRRMVRDLNFPLKLVVAPTLREPDGLAMSSRNVYLSEEERGQATLLWKLLHLARQEVRKGPIGYRDLLRKCENFTRQFSTARIDYIAFFDENTLLPVQQVRRGVRMSMAIFIGKTRLIDNALL